MMYNLKLLVLIGFSVFYYFRCTPVFAAKNRPHIIIIVADDLGWNDVGFHGSNQIFTPNIDALAYNGIVFNSHYVLSTDSGTRSALLTGKYPIHLGLQGATFKPNDKRSVSDEKLMPEYFKELGYSTYLIGKWNLGFSSWNDTPTNRGFDHHFGFYNEFVSYYDYVAAFEVNNTVYSGFDLRKDMEVDWSTAGKYATDAFNDYAQQVIEAHDPNKPLFLMISHLAVHSANSGKRLEAPQETINKFKHIVDPNRRTYAAMVSKLDDSVGQIISALQKQELLSNSIVLFLSDNGAPTTGPSHNWGSNYPLRGIQGSLFEGGIRSVAILYSRLLFQQAYVSQNLIHVTDWLPTLYRAAVIDSDDVNPELSHTIDGLDHWFSLVYSFSSPRDHVLLNIDTKAKYAAIRVSRWKCIIGLPLTKSRCNYAGDSGSNNLMQIPYNFSAVLNSLAAKALQTMKPTNIDTQIRVIESLRNDATVRCLNPKLSKPTECDPHNSTIFLYDIVADPCEKRNVANYSLQVLRQMNAALKKYIKDLVPQQSDPFDSIQNADPKLFDFVWTPWLDG